MPTGEEGYAGASFPSSADEAYQPTDEPGSSVGKRSLLEDFEALFSDARVYYHAELAFQKTRAAFLADSLKRTIIFATAGAFFGMLATIGLAVGLIIALTPIVGAWVATALVVSLILILGGWCLWKATASWRTMMHAIRDDDHKEASHHG